MKESTIVSFSLRKEADADILSFLDECNAKGLGTTKVIRTALQGYMKQKQDEERPIPKQPLMPSLMACVIDNNGKVLEDKKQRRELTEDEVYE